MTQVLLWALALLLAAIFLLLTLAGAFFLLRKTPLERIRDMGTDGPTPGARDGAFRRLAESHLGVELTRRNRVEVLFDGDELFPRLFADLESATDLVTWHVFWFKPGKLADRLKGVLARRAQAGVRVLFLYDWYGSQGIGEEYLEALRQAGVEVACFRPPRLATLYKIQQRSHARTVVIDGKVGYTGGFAIADEWLGDGRTPGCWRDTSVRLQGPAVYQLQAGFVDDWAEATSELLVGESVFPDDDARPGQTNAGVFFSTPGLGTTQAEQHFALSIWGARETLYVTNAYFVLRPAFRRFLRDAVERGVDVRVLTPGANTDRPSTWYAGRTAYEELLEAGVRIYEYRPAMVHAKTLVADRAWSSVGTLNFDNRSMALNDEVALLCHDEALGERLHRRFLEDLGLADELELEAFRARGAGERLKERFYDAFSRVL